MEDAPVRRARMRVFARAVDGTPVAGVIDGLDQTTAEGMAAQLRLEGVQARAETDPRGGWRVAWLLAGREV